VARSIRTTGARDRDAAAHSRGDGGQPGGSQARGWLPRQRAGSTQIVSLDTGAGTGREGAPNGRNPVGAVREHAWQLAQTTQALVDIDADLSFSLARVYGVQALYQGLTDGINNAMYLRPPTENMTAFRHSLALYYGDIVIIEPALEKLYDEVLPQIDRALDR
jgi:hypothetical protein